MKLHEYWKYILERSKAIYSYFCFMILEPDLYEAVTQHSSLLILLENHMSLALGNLNVTIMCRNDEFSWTMS